jgi:alpha-ribazole phosphatase
VQACCLDFADHRPGGGEPVAALLGRCDDIMADHRDEATVCIVGHAGWISAALWRQHRGNARPQSEAWPGAANYAERVSLERGCAAPTAVAR